MLKKVIQGGKLNRFSLFYSATCIEGEKYAGVKRAERCALQKHWGKAVGVHLQGRGQDWCVLHFHLLVPLKAAQRQGNELCLLHMR